MCSLHIEYTENDIRNRVHSKVFMGSQTVPDSKVHGAHMGPIWGRQDPGGHHVGPMNFVIWACHGSPYIIWFFFIKHDWTITDDQEIQLYHLDLFTRIIYLYFNFLFQLFVAYQRLVRFYIYPILSYLDSLLSIHVSLKRQPTFYK